MTSVLHPSHPPPASRPVVEVRSRDVECQAVDWPPPTDTKPFNFVICPALQPLDIVKLVVGRTIRRDSEGWVIYARANKNNYRLAGRLGDICTPYRDEAILLLFSDRRTPRRD